MHGSHSLDNFVQQRHGGVYLGHYRLLHHLLQQAARQGMGPMLFTDVHMSFNRQCDTLLQTRPQDKAECMRFLKVLGGHVHAFLRCM